MQRAENPAELRTILDGLRADGGVVGFVPTMGCLHEGHGSLMQKARGEVGHLVASVYVNPKQFGPDEDFDAYPRQLEDDLAFCQAQGVDVVYTPRDEVMYPRDFTSFVQEEVLSVPLCGQGRPGHFRGVTTVVTKLLNQVRPDRSYFGQKDAQQALIIQRMVRDLDLPGEVVLCPIVRDEHGLALSSRNRYLDDAGRSASLTLRRALQAIEQAFEGGERSADALVAAGKAVFKGVEGVKLEYLQVVSRDHLMQLPTLEGVCLAAVAAQVKGARLIDNSVLDAESGKVRATLF